jgi:general secretion pathway protein N
VADAFRPLTLLLGAVCLWAFCVLVLALAGLGSRFAEPGPGVAPPRLPDVRLTPGRSRLGPMSDYLVVGERPLLNPDRRPSLQLAVDGEAGSADIDVMLTSVLLTPHLQLAILTDNKDASTRRVRVGEMIAGSSWRLVQLEPRRAVIEGPSGQRSLDLRVFDGKGGEAPTPTVAEPTADAGATGNSGVGPSTGTAAAPRPQPMPTPAPPATASQPPPAQEIAPVTPDQQVEAIRRRIEARRAQMRAEAAAAGAPEKQ